MSLRANQSRDMSPEDEAVGMAIPDGFRLQEQSRSAALKTYLVKRGVLRVLRPGRGWFRGLTTRKSQERTK